MLRKTILGAALAVATACMAPATAQAQANCQFISNPSEDGHVRIALAFVDAWNRGAFSDARRLFTADATVRGGFYDDEIKPLSEVVAEAQQAGGERSQYTVMGIMTDGSNLVALKLLADDADDDVAEIWVFGVGSGCLTDLQIF